MTVEQIAIRQEVRQMLNEAGINKDTLKDMVKELLSEEIQKACKQAMRERPVETMIKREIESNIKNGIRTETKEYIREIFGKATVSVGFVEGTVSTAQEESWIPCSEKLPEVGRDVLAKWEKYDRWNDAIITHTDILHVDKTTGEWIGLMGRVNGQVVKWMKIPK